MADRVLTVIGSANADLIMRLPHLPAPAETVTGGVLSRARGGKGANTAVAAARLGARVRFIGGVGNDESGRECADALAAAGVDVAGIFTSSEVATGTAFILLDAAGTNSITVAPGANYELSPAHIRAHRELIQASDFVLLQMELRPETTVAAIEAAEGRPVLLNYAPASNPQVPVDSRISVLVVNEVEAGMLAKCSVRNPDEAVAAAEGLRRSGPERVVVTLGGQGMVMVGKEESVVLSAFAVTPVDTTAAGDIFCGALALALSEGLGGVAAARFASAAAAISVTRAGAQASAPTRAEVEVFLDQQHS